MKIKHISIFLYISLFINVFLGIYIAGRQPICEREHMDDIDRGSELCDAEMARKIAEIYHKRIEIWTLRDDVEYDCRVLFHEETNEWLVIHTPISSYCEEGVWIDETLITLIAGIRRDTGYCRDYMSLVDVMGICPDKETAIQLAEAECKRVSKNPNRSLRDDIEYDRQVFFDIEMPQWVVMYIPILPEEMAWMEAETEYPSRIFGVNAVWVKYYDALDEIPWFGCNEEIAIQIAEAKYRRCYEEPFWITQSKVRYDCDVFFNKGSYEWIIVYTPILPEGKEERTEYPVKIAGVRNDSGYCTFYESLEDISGFQGR